MYQKKVTIGIPVYNEVAFIRHTLTSVLEQGAEQIVLSDNASTDGTSAICQEFANAHACITYHRYETTQPVMHNFMNCLRLANHDYYMVMGGHDFLSKNYVRELRHVLDTTESVLAYSNAVHVNHEYVFKHVYEYAYAVTLQQSDSLQRLLAIITLLDNCTMYYGLFHRDVFAAAHMKSESQACIDMDHCVLARIAVAGIMTLCPVTTFYRVDPPRQEEAVTKRWKRVLRAAYAKEYDPVTHPPELIPASIIMHQLRIVHDLVHKMADGQSFIVGILRVLLKRWNMNNKVLEIVLPHILPLLRHYKIHMPSILREM